MTASMCFTQGLKVFCSHSNFHGHAIGKLALTDVHRIAHGRNGRSPAPAQGPASNPLPSGLLPSGLGMAKSTIPQAEVLWGALQPGIGPRAPVPETSGNGRPKRARNVCSKS